MNAPDVHAHDEASIPSWLELEPQIATLELALQYIQNRGFAVPPLACSNILPGVGVCGGTMKPHKGSLVLRRCSRNACRRAVSIFQHTFYSRFHKTLPEILHFAYLYINNATHKDITNQTRFAPATVTAIMGFLDDVIYEDFHRIPIADRMIGGNQIVVQLDETKFGKRHGNVGHNVNGVWVFGGVELTEERKFFAISVPDRSAATLTAACAANIKPGSIIHTDRWRGYRDDHLHGIQMGGHLTVNHTVHFVDPITGVNTNTIEGTWNALKQHIPKRHYNTESIDAEIVKYNWRRRYRNSLWNQLLHAMHAMHYDD